MPGKLEYFERFTNRMSHLLRWVAIAGMVIMSLATAVDVIGAKLFRWPLPGAFEGTSLLGLVIIVFSLPFTQTQRGHIEIDLLTERFPKGAQKIVGSMVSLLGITLFALITWQMFRFAQTIRIVGRITETLEIPLYPFAYGAAICFFTVFLILVLQFLKMWAEVLKK